MRKNLLGYITLRFLAIFIPLLILAVGLDSIFHLLKENNLISDRELHFILLGLVIFFIFLGSIIVALSSVKREIALKDLKESEEKFRLLFNDATDAILIYELDSLTQPGKIINANSSACEQLGYSQEEILSLFVHDIAPKSVYEDEQMLTLLQQGHGTIELIRVSKNGRIIHTESSLHVVSINGKNIVMSVGRDITERKKVEKIINHQATHDILTNLPNRALFHDRLNMAITNAHRYGYKPVVMFLDLDNFKGVNDKLGHAAGDELLISVAQRLTGLLRESDTVARIGGDEFILLFPDVIEYEMASTLAQKVIDSFNLPFYFNGLEIKNITPSVGVAVYPINGEDATSLLKNADTALYQVKTIGKNSFRIYTPNY